MLAVCSLKFHWILIGFSLDFEVSQWKINGFDQIVSIRPPSGPDLLTHICAQANAMGLKSFTSVLFRNDGMHIFDSTTFRFFNLR